LESKAIDMNVCACGSEIEKPHVGHWSCMMRYCEELPLEQKLDLCWKGWEQARHLHEMHAFMGIRNHKLEELLQPIDFEKKERYKIKFVCIDQEEKELSQKIADILNGREGVNKIIELIAKKHKKFKEVERLISVIGYVRPSCLTHEPEGVVCLMDGMLPEEKE